MRALTDRQREVLRFIVGYYEAHGVPPSIRDIREALGVRSTNGVNDHLKAIGRKGYLRKGGKWTSRAWVPVRDCEGREVRIVRVEPEAPAAAEPNPGAEEGAA